MDGSLLTGSGKVAFKELNNPEEKIEQYTREHERSPAIDAGINWRKAVVQIYQTDGFYPGDGSIYSYLG